jgi:hypothetical protein
MRVSVVAGRRGGAVEGRCRPRLMLVYAGSTGRAYGEGSGEANTDIGAVSGRTDARGPDDVDGRTRDLPSERENDLRVESREESG